jgi:hypothetical protein
VTVGERPAKITVDLGDAELHRRLRHAGIDNDMSVRDIAIEALRFWLDHQDLVEDTLASEKIQQVVSESRRRVSHDEVHNRVSD